MKKTLLVSIFLTAGFAVFGEEVTLDTLLERITETSYRKEMYELEQKKTEALEKFYKIDNYNGVKSSVTTRYDDTERIYRTTGRAEFGDLYIEGKEVPNKDDDLIFGINKSIKDMIFSKNDSNLLKNDLKKEADKYTFLKNMEEQKIALIALYRDYKNMEFEIKKKKERTENFKIRRENPWKIFWAWGNPKNRTGISPVQP